MITPSRAVMILNRALEADRKAVRRILTTGFTANDRLVADPDIPTVNMMHVGEDGIACVTAFGLISAMFGAANSGLGYVAALEGPQGIIRFVELDDDGRVL
jgi:hypothetical protein